MKLLIITIPMTVSITFSGSFMLFITSEFAESLSVLSEGVGRNSSSPGAAFRLTPGLSTVQKY
jgi:hypothetical protein